MRDSARYAKIVEGSPEDQCYVGSAPGLVYAGCHGEDEQAVFEELCQVVDEAISKRGARATEGLPHAPGVVSRKLVQPYPIARPKTGAQTRVDRDTEGGAVQGTRKDHGGRHTRKTQRASPGLVAACETIIERWEAKGETEYVNTMLRRVEAAMDQRLPSEQASQEAWAREMKKAPGLAIVFQRWEVRQKNPRERVLELGIELVPSLEQEREL